MDLTYIVGTTDESHWPVILAEKPENWFSKKAQVIQAAKEEAERERLANLKAAEEERLAKEAEEKRLVEANRENQIKEADNKDLEEAGEDLSLWKSVEASD